MTYENHTSEIAIWKWNLAQHDTHYAHFVQSTTKQFVHFRSKILWPYVQATMAVRPYPLTPYVLTPFERTTKHPIDVRPWEKVLGKYGILYLSNAIVGCLRIALFTQKDIIGCFF